MRNSTLLPCAIAFLTLAACRKAAPPTEHPGESTTAVSASVIATEKGFATWYRVPLQSIPARRAPGELTAASDQFPRGTILRITNLENHRNVVVRITDTGVHRKRTVDLCKEAAAEIGLVSEGIVEVWIERLAAAEAITADPRKP